MGDSGTVERPAGVTASAKWASDELASLLRELDIPFVALNPGSSYRGLHDSLVNYLGNRDPQMLLCLHEEHAVAIAHGYAKVTDRPMAVALHSNVGLMHASMAIFNAFCDRVPMLLLGATGPLDADRRRPWIDWLHTATDQAALVRPYLKWDDQPLSVPAALEAMLQAHRLASSVPRAPTYVCLDASMQEAPLETLATRPRPSRFAAATPPAPDAATVADLADRLTTARRPVLLVGRTSRSETSWARRTALAERLGARVFTHLKCPGAFPTAHPLHTAAPNTFTSPGLARALREADVIISLDWLDLGGTVRAAGEVNGYLVSVSLDDQLHSGWGKESLAPAPADLRLGADVDATVAALLDALAEGSGPAVMSSAVPAEHPEIGSEGPLKVADIAQALRAALGERPSTLVRIPHGWSGDLWPVTHPLDMLGADGGEGVGSGPGMVVGAALALRDSDRLAVGVLGDGDLAMGVNALWTAAHYEIPLLIVVANNHSFFNDEIHQHQVAVRRDRPVANRWIGQHMTGPDLDFVGLARAQGLTAFGPVDTRDALASTLGDAVVAAEAGAPVVVDVRIESSVDSEGSRAVTQGGRR